MIKLAIAKTASSSGDLVELPPIKSGFVSDEPDYIDSHPFVLSTIAMQLLFPNRVFFDFNPSVRDAMFDNSRNILSTAFIATVRAVQNWRTMSTHMLKVQDLAIILVERCGKINDEFTRELFYLSKLSPLACFSNCDFQIRLGEELLIWAIKHGEAITPCGLSIDGYGNLVLVRKEKKIKLIVP